MALQLLSPGNLIDELAEIEDFLDRPLDHVDDLDTRLAVARSTLEGLVAQCDRGSDQQLDALRMLLRVHNLQGVRADDSLTRAVSGLSHIQHSMQVLSILTPQELIEAVPLRASTDLHLERVMISAISGTIWVPKRLHLTDAEKDRAFLSFVEGARIPLAAAPLETEIVRRRAAALVPNPHADSRTYRDIVDVSGSPGYIVAPLLSRGRVLGVLHADRAGSGCPVTQDDLGLLKIFAECVSISYEAAVLRERLLSSPAWTTSAHELDRILREEAAPDPRRPSASSAAVSAPANQLTSRERQVISQMATGATNGQIARALIISDETVKSHIKQIFKKLGVSSRAEAIARFSAQARSGYAVRA